MFKTINIFILVCTLGACSTNNKSILAGSAIGGTSGLLIGKAHKTKHGKAVGGAIGSSLGGFVGFLSKKQVDKNKLKSKHSKQPLKNKTLVTPLLTKPKVKMYWEPDQIQGNRYIEKHRVWIIESRPEWTK